MSDDYAVPGKRKSKRDKIAKARYNKYKKGGRFRSAKISLKGDSGDEDRKKKKRK